MAVPLVVPDASVLLKWVLPSDDEPEADKALHLRAAIVDDTVHAIVPPLWIYEVGNTVARRFPAHAQTWLSALLRFGLEEMPASQAWLGKSLELTSRHEVSFYDAAYHALALLHKGLFVTADAKYANRASGSGSVITLAEWKPPDPRESRRHSKQ
jgi:predicted nucleic acid-binding protein